MVGEIYDLDLDNGDYNDDGEMEDVIDEGGGDDD